MLDYWFQFGLLLGTAFCSVQGAYNYYGKYIGPLHGYHHGVQGEVYAVDVRTLYIKDFSYDGQGPAAYFWAGSSSQPDASGFALRDERQSGTELKSYRKKSVTLTLPEGKSLTQVKWFSIWCESAAVNFGDIRIPKGFDYPRPQKIGQLAGVHGVSSDPIVIVDAQTLLIPNFSYDGEAPDAKFWVGTGPHPSPQGVRVPDENGKEDPLRRYNRKTIVLTLPGELTVFEIGHFGVWCEAFTVDFGHLQIPTNVNIPPSLKMLGVSPQTNLVGQNVVNKIIEKVNVLFSIDPSSHSSTPYQQYQQPRPSATNQQYQQYQPSPTTIFHSFQQQYQNQYQNPYIPVIQNQYLQPTFYSQQNSKQQEQNKQAETKSLFSRPLTTKSSQDQTFVPNFSVGQGQTQLNYPFNLQNPHVIFLNQQYEQTASLPVQSHQSSIYNTQDVQQLVASLPPNSHRLGPVHSQQTKTQAQKEDKVTTYKPPSLDIHKFITKQQIINSNKNKRNQNNDNVQIVQSISYDVDQTFEPSNDNLVILESPLERSGYSDDTNDDIKIERKREVSKTTEKKEEEIESSTAKDVSVQTVTPYISDPIIQLKEALIYDPISRTYKTENLFYTQNNKGGFERYESKKIGEAKNFRKSESRQRKRPNRRIYAEDIEEINSEFKKYSPETSDKVQDISIEDATRNDENLNNRYAQDAYIDLQFKAHEKHNLDKGKNIQPENDYDYKTQTVTSEPKKYLKVFKKPHIRGYPVKSKNTIIQTPNYSYESNLDGTINEGLSYNTTGDHVKHNRETNRDQLENYRSLQNTRKTPRVLTEEYFNARPIESNRLNRFHDEGIIQKLPLEKEIHFDIPTSPLNKYPETGKSVIYYPQYTGEQFYDDINKAKEYPKQPKVANDDYNEPPTDTDYYDQPQSYNNDYNIHNLQDENYRQKNQSRYQNKPKISYYLPKNFDKSSSSRTKPNKFVPQSQSPQEILDYYSQYPETTDNTEFSQKSRNNIEYLSQSLHKAPVYNQYTKTTEKIGLSQTKSNNIDPQSQYLQVSQDYNTQYPDTTDKASFNQKESKIFEPQNQSLQISTDYNQYLKTTEKPRFSRKKPNTFEPESQNPLRSPDYNSQYPDETDAYTDDNEKEYQYKGYNSPKPNTIQYKEQFTPQSYPENPPQVYNDDLKYVSERYQPPTPAPVDYYDHTNGEMYHENSKNQVENYYKPERQVVNDETVVSTPAPYKGGHKLEEETNDPQNTQSRISAEVYLDDPKTNYDYYEKSDYIKYVNKPEDGKKMDPLAEQYYNQFKTEEDKPSGTSTPKNTLRYEVKDDIIKKYYTANDLNRFRAPTIETTDIPKVSSPKNLRIYYKPEKIPYVPTTSSDIESNLNNDNTITPKYHYESQPTQPYEIPASSAMKDDVLFKVYKENLQNIQDRNLQIQEKAHKEREGQIQNQVYEQYKRQQTVSTIPPASVPHLKTPINVEITSY